MPSTGQMNARHIVEVLQEIPVVTKKYFTRVFSKQGRTLTPQTLNNDFITFVYSSSNVGKHAEYVVIFTLQL